MSVREQQAALIAYAVELVLATKESDRKIDNLIRFLTGTANPYEEK